MNDIEASCRLDETRLSQRDYTLSLIREACRNGELTEEDLLDQDVRWEPKDGNRKNVVLENLIFIKKPKNIRTKEAAIEYYENLIKGLKEQD